jgi:hypothetical protein
MNDKEKLIKNIERMDKFNNKFLYILIESIFKFFIPLSIFYICLILFRTVMKHLRIDEYHLIILISYSLILFILFGFFWGLYRLKIFTLFKNNKFNKDDKTLRFWHFFFYILSFILILLINMFDIFNLNNLKNNIFDLYINLFLGIIIGSLFGYISWKNLVSLSMNK